MHFFTFCMLLTFTGLTAGVAASPGSLPTHTHHDDLPSCSPEFLHKQGALPLGEVAKLFRTATVPANPSSAADIELIRATLSRYALAIDSREFALLDDVFTPDVRTNYSSALGVMNGIDAVKQGLSLALGSFTHTQHQLGTSQIQLCRDDDAAGRDSAVSLSYVLATHFQNTDGVLPAVVSVDEVIIVHAMYQDILVREGGNHGAEVTWRIRARDMLYLGPLVGKITA
ncbi:nuclear transport factor 2 family protein [Microdochium nivale]|nr:nuclear transport factor 2 family protein [Microdochium nivale]